MRDFSRDISALALNTATIRQWDLRHIVDNCAKAGIKHISPWRDQVRSEGTATVRRWLSEAGLHPSAYLRAGLFTYADREAAANARDENFAAMDEAAELGCRNLVVLAGGLPKAADLPKERNIEAARYQVGRGIEDMLPRARDLGLKLVVEPLHPMYAADRCCLNTLDQVLDLCDELDPASEVIGVAIDVYHVWWDPRLREQIDRAGSVNGRIQAFHVNDWLVPTRDMLNDRGMMGDGIIDIPKIRNWVESAGYGGPCEVEIFSDAWREREGQEVLNTCVDRFRRFV